MILKPKATRHLKFRTGRPEASRRKDRPVMSEERITVLGTVVREEGGEALAFPISPDMPAEEITAMLEAAEAARIEAAKQESERLKTIFLRDLSKASLS